MRRWILAIALGVPLSLAVTVLLNMFQADWQTAPAVSNWQWMGDLPEGWWPKDIKRQGTGYSTVTYQVSVEGFVRVEEISTLVSGFPYEHVMHATGFPFYSFTSSSYPSDPYAPRWRGVIANAGIATLFVYAILSVIALVRNRLRRAHNACTHCGYQLIAPCTLCPECGTLVRKPQVPAS